MSFLLRDAYLALKPDKWRTSNPFSDDIGKANEILLHPFASQAQKWEALRLWLQRKQLCIFGRIAASMNRIHLCLLSEADLHSPDEEVADLIGVERNRWKQRCLRNEQPEHGFLLLAATPRIALASPNTDLYLFSKILRDLCSADIQRDEKGNDIAWEYLYLKHPDEDKCFRFKFSLDYFAVQGDGRWWHDHRIPGGIAYTANSVGHMMRTREWYEGKGTQQTEWAVKIAMETVDESADTKWGKAIRLRNLAGQKPYRGSKCPFSTLETLKPRLKGKDWSAYEGTISTDHSLRKELFREEPEPPDDLARWNQDLEYLYAEANPAFQQFVPGEDVPCSQVIQLLGDPAQRRILSGFGQMTVDPGYGPIDSKLADLAKEWAFETPWD